MHQAYHYIGLDIHKRTISFCEKRADGKTMAAGKFGARKDQIQQWASERKTPWIGGMEATLFTGYVYDLLTPYALEIQVGHPLKLKAISSAKHKSDSIDAETLSNLLRADLFPACHMASPQIREQRRVLRYRNFMVRQAVALKNKTVGLLMETGVVYDSSRIHRQGYFHEFVDNLQEIPESVRELLRTTRAGLEMFMSAQKQLINALKQNDTLAKRVKRLMSINGVGEITALTWALEVGDPARFSNIKKAQSYCGLCSGRNESGGKDKRAPLSKQRNPHLQTMLIEAAKLAPRYNEQLARVHAAALEHGYNHNRATCAVARKLVAYLMAVDKSDQDYQDHSQAT